MTTKVAEMKYLILIFVCYIVATDANIEFVLTPNNYNPVGVTYCYSEITGIMEIGAEMSIEGECRKATCEENGKIVIRKCNNIPMSPCGILTADFTQPFPLCCPQPQQCPNKG